MEVPKMSAFTFNCQHCNQSLEAEADMRGMVLDCPNCSRQITVPSCEKPIE